ncbi:hypothetical protein A8F94_24600 [Bacillus sp. FJAT-27225]|uniref:DUF6241 domain-containing protein n=1 Tax=Bacillus sp. FJAT-27225 TaxID=1743144 RepID=UPI00080C2FEF|nr:DUF6241 domain-containing protein [Bacillus sp. FJAT-27225]OCA88396.1 hypothetical protein A8F94_24600 [Bacillus sp. FJAT-27225]
MKRITTLLFIAIIGLGSYMAYDTSQKKKEQKESDKVIELTEEPEAPATVIEPIEETVEPVEESSPVFLFQEVLTKEEIEQKYPLTMTELEMQNTLHGMTHQKIRAEMKRGLTPMTLERVERLLQVVEANVDTYAKEDAYLEMLYSWKRGNFSQVELQHNTLWAFQDGEVGQAYGVLTPAEEKAFIEENYEVLAEGAE